jgi:hypothetical protein
MSKRNIMRVELNGPAKQNIAKIHDHHGMTQVAMMSRLVEWFSKQDLTMQSAILGRFPSELKTDIAKLLLERMAKRG